MAHRNQTGHDHVGRGGIARRDLLKAGALAGMGLDLRGFLALPPAARRKPDAAAIFVRLGGGPSHMDTFDMKPDAPDTHRGEFREIATNVAGVRICEHLPRLARCADKYAILRGVSHTLAAHDLGSIYLATGNRPLPSLRFPAYGAVASKELQAPPQLPAHVAIPSEGRGGTGYLGVQYSAFETGSTPRAGRAMDVRGLALRGVAPEDIDRRQQMLARYDNAFGDFATEDELLAGMDEFGRKAYEMMRSKEARAAFDLTQESESIRALFDEKQAFAQSCMLATRLVEAGVRFVTLSLGGWDTHANNFPSLKDRLLPALDAGLSGLLLALDAKGLLGSTTVFVTGEFGRTPKINARGGRDHYPRAMFCVLAGGGIRGGQVVGASDAKGELPKDDPITPDDVAASFYHSLGIDHTREYHTPTGRPVMIVRHGTPIRALF